MNNSKISALFFITFLFLFITNGFSKSRTTSEALNIASSFSQKYQSLTKGVSSGSTALKLAYTCADSIATRSLNGNVYYYVFNKGEDNGFVIVSGDDRAKEILGYSDSGNFNSASLPSNFLAWLGFYQKEMKSLMDQPEAVTTSTVQLNAPAINTRQTTFATSVAPLLGGIKWDQGSPYNNLCPTISIQSPERTVTGCVATAMAQVMRYHKWPVSGKGSNTYTPYGYAKPLSVDFSKTTYDWGNMAETYNSSSTAAQNLAVATLMYHAGVAVNMNYDISSSANILDMANALIKNFSYDSSLQSYKRDYYSKSEWENLLKTELNAQRPILYAGSSTDVGHQFVCDGYDSNGLFHFNWGWSGSSDGYFELSVLNPAALGIGGGTSGGFNYDQVIVAGVKKQSASSSIAPYQLYINSPLKTSANTVSRSGSFTIKAELYNYGVNTFSGSIGLALYNESGFVKLIKSYSNETINPYYGWPSLDYSTSITTSLVANGNYKLYSVYKATEQSEWQIMRGKTGTPNYLNVALTSSNVTFGTPDVLPKLTLNSFSTTGNLYQNTTGRFNINITNNGGEYNSNLIIQLRSVADSSITQILCSDPVNIPSGATKSFDLMGYVSLSAGQYYLYAFYDPLNNRTNASSFNSLADPLTVNVLAEPTEKSALTLTSQISFPNAAQVDKENAVLTAKIKNNGEYFEDYVVAFVYPINDYNALTFFGFQKIILDKNEEKEITFSGNIDLEPGSYLTVVTYSTTSGNSYSFFDPNDYTKLVFTLPNESTGIEQTKQDKLILYPIPATDILFMKSDEVVKTISIMDLSGKQVLLMKPKISGEISIPVNELSVGTYILRSETAAGIKVSKFIKK